MTKRRKKVTAALFTFGILLIFMTMTVFGASEEAPKSQMYATFWH